MHPKKTTLAAAVSAVLLHPAHAQEEPTPEAVRSEKEVIEQITVTAQKREQSLQDVPMSISAYSELELERRGATQFTDIGNSVPGLSISQGVARGEFVPVIRGVQIGGVSPTTAFYIDEMPLQPQEFERFGMPDPNFFDVERVEVLKGPQGTLYGSNAMGGVIRVVLKKPDPTEFFGAAAVDVSTVDGGGDNYRFNGAVNVPISETLAVRASMEYQDRGGFVDLLPVEDLGTGTVENADSHDVRAGRIILSWKPSERLTVEPSVFYQKMEADDRTYVSFGLSKERGEPVNYNTGFPKLRKNEIIIGNMELRYDLDWAEVMSSSTYYELDFLGTSDWTGFVSGFAARETDGAFDGFLPTPNINEGGEEQFIQEVRMTTDFTDFPVNFVIGAFYRDIEAPFRQSAFCQECLDDPIASQTSLATVHGGNIFLKDDEIEQLEETAVYGHAFWQVTDRLELQAGIRWFDYSRDRFVPTSSGLFGFPTRATEASDSDVTPAFAARYDVDNDTTVYARVAKGFRPGFGFATSFPPSVCDEDLAELGIDDPSEVFGQVDPDTIWNYETGVKTNLFNDALRFNLSAYYIDWTDVQVEIQLPTCAFRLDQNAGSASVKGAEAEWSALLPLGLTFQGSIGYVDAQLTEDIRGIGQDGDRLPIASRWNVFASLQYDFDAGRDLSGFFRVDATYTDSAPWRFPPITETSRKPSLTQVNLRLGVETLDDWQAEFYVHNLQDNLEIGYGCGFSSFAASASGDVGTCPNTPREIGVKLQRRF